jgi:hypothetical protein
MPEQRARRVAAERAGLGEGAGSEVRAHVERAEEADVLISPRDSGTRDAVLR